MTTTTQHIDDHKLTEIKVPRTRKPPSRYIVSGAAYAPATTIDHFRPLMFQFIDVAITAIEGLFTKSKGLLEYQQLENALIAEEDEEKIQQILSPYTETNFQSFLTEIRMFRRMKYSNVAQAAELLRTMSNDMRCLFAEVEKLVCLRMVCPAVSAETERSLSALRRLKTWLRSTTTQES